MQALAARLGSKCASAAAVLTIASLVDHTASAASRLSLAPKVILAPDKAAAPGTEITLRAGETVLKAPLGWLSAARLEGAVTFQVGGRSGRLLANSVLIGAIPTGGDIRTLTGDAIVFCSGERSEAELGIATLAWDASGSGGRGDDVAGRVCLLDQDSDGRFDRAVLPGAKRPDDRRPIELAPVPYKAQTGMPMAGASEVRIVYQSGSAFRIDVLEGGKRQKFGLFSARLGPSTILQASRVFRVQKKRLPQRQLVGSAAFTVLEMDEAASEVRVQIERDFYLAPYALGEGARTIHIYVP